MGLFDSLGSVASSILNTPEVQSTLGKLESETLPALLPQILAQTGLGDVGGLLAQLQRSGLGDEVKSWLGNGANLPVTADQLRAARGDQHLQQIARTLGLPVDDVLAMLAKSLPQTIDTMSPNGTLRQG